MLPYVEWSKNDSCYYLYRDKNDNGYAYWWLDKWKEVNMTKVSQERIEQVAKTLALQFGIGERYACAIAKTVLEADTDSARAEERLMFEAWSKTRHVTAFDRNPIGTWGDEKGEKYVAHFVQPSWEGWEARSRAALPARVEDQLQAFIVGNSEGTKFRKWGDCGPEWTADRDDALHFARRKDAESFAAEDDDAWLILPVTPVAAETDKGWRTIDSAPTPAPDDRKALYVMGYTSWGEHVGAFHEYVGLCEYFHPEGYQFIDTDFDMFPKPKLWQPVYLPTSPSTDQQGGA